MLLLAGDDVPVANPIFDESGNFVLVPSLLGIKVINITTNSVARIIGQPENTERFLAIALWQGLPKKVRMCVRMSVQGGGWVGFVKGGGAAGMSLSCMAVAATQHVEGRKQAAAKAAKGALCTPKQPSAGKE